MVSVVKATLSLFALLIGGAWTEPPRSIPPTPMSCQVSRAVDGDTIAATCSPGGEVRFRLRGVDTPERGEARYREATAALATMLHRCGWRVVAIPHHRTRGRVAASVLCGGRDLGRDMDAAGWSKAVGARR